LSTLLIFVRTARLKDSLTNGFATVVGSI